MKKKKNSVKFLTLVIIMVMSITATVYAIDSGNNQIKESRSISELKDEILVEKVTTDGLQKKHKINNIDRFKEAIKEKNPEMSDYELGKTILLSLGDDEDFISSLPEEKVLEALEYTSVETAESFLKATPEGDLVEISEELFYSPDTSQNIAESNHIVQTQAFSSLNFSQANIQALALTLPDSSNTFGDIVLRARAYKRSRNPALPGRDCFTIRGEVEWEGYADFAFRDLLTISSEGEIDNSYSHYAQAEWKMWTEDGLTFVYDTAYVDGNTNNNLLSFDCHDTHALGVKIPLLRYKSTYNHTYEGRLHRAYAYYGVTAQEDISCQVSYAHAIVAWTPSFSVDSNATTTFGGLSVQRQAFYMTPFTLYHNILYK